MTFPERIWVGPDFSKMKIFVLGESWYGNYPEDLATDDGYIQAYLEGRVPDRMYTRMANACDMTPKEFWGSSMFTNFVQRVGATRDHRPSTEQYKAAQPRLGCLLNEHRPRGVWILGIEQSTYSAPVVEAAGIPFEITAHPTSYGLKNATLGASWNALIKKSVTVVAIK